MPPRCRGSPHVKVVFDVFHFDGIGVLVDGMHYFAPQITKCLLLVAIWARATPCLILIYLDKDGETNWVTLIWWCFRLKYAIYQWTRQRIHNTLIVIGRYLRLMGDKTIPNSAGLVWNRCITHSPQVSIYHIKVWWILIIRYITSVFALWRTGSISITPQEVHQQFENVNDNSKYLLSSSSKNYPWRSIFSYLSWCNTRYQ